jgi:hypothetical protein
MTLEKYLEVLKILGDNLSALTPGIGEIGLYRNLKKSYSYNTRDAVFMVLFAGFAKTAAVYDVLQGRVPSFESLVGYTFSYAGEVLASNQ